jgi:hypothetical protein
VVVVVVVVVVAVVVTVVVGLLLFLRDFYEVDFFSFQPNLTLIPFPLFT